MPELTVELRTSDFDYYLPHELIAQTPLPDRAGSRLLVVRRLGGWAVGQTGSGAEGRTGSLAVGQTGGPAEPHFEDRIFADLPSLIPPGDLLVLNTTRVRHGRLIGRRPSGASAEVLLLHPAADDTWIAMGRPGSALRPGKRIQLGEGIEVETIEVLEQGYRRVRILGATAEQAMSRLGRLPLPPYIEREPTAEDDRRYQTVFAEREGSVAAPTAGLHFTEDLLRELKAGGVGLARLGLEVGPGTFKPVEDENIASHPMHPERFEIPAETAEDVSATHSRGGKIWAVGSTVVRALESAADDDGTVRAGRGETRLLIVPGYRFRVVDHLLTNFHLPRSTLIMLVSAFAGHEATMSAYRHAVRERYRFYSYGDAMLVL